MTEPLGRQLWALYLGMVYPFAEPPDLDILDAGQIAALVMPLVAKMGPPRDASDEPIDDVAIDNALRMIADGGGLEATSQLSETIRRELAALARDAFVALTLEHFGNTSFNIPLPRHASDEIRATAALLFLLGSLRTDVPLRSRLRQAARRPPNRRPTPRR